MATLVNGNGNVAVYAQQDADLLTGALGASTRIMNVGSKMAYTIEDANTIAVADGVILTKEGRRIQVDVGNVDEFTIPTGSAGVTRYYIIGYHLYTDGSANQKCETFVQLMSNGSETITENTFRNGASEVYVSLYRVKQIGLNLDTITALLSVGIALTDMTDVIGDTDISGIGDGTLTGGLNAVNQKLTEKIEQKSGSLSDGTDTYTGINLDFISYDATAKKLLLHEKGTGADAVIPFSGGSPIKAMVCWRDDGSSGFSPLSGMYMDENGNIGAVNSWSTLALCGFCTGQQYGTYIRTTFTQEGDYYIQSVAQSTPVHKNVGDVVDLSYTTHSFAIIKVG